MHVVGHQTVGVEKERQADLLHGEERKELLIVRRRVEYLSPVVASRDHMIETTGNFSTSFAGHAPRMLRVAKASVNPDRSQGFCISRLRLECKGFD